MNLLVHLIVGIDPGKTCGIACLDLDGKLVLKGHMLFGGESWIIETVVKAGTPVIVASDKADPSALVRKINTAFSSRLYCPERELKMSEKRIAARRMGIKNPHERDAYIAAISAFNSFSNKFKQAEHIAREVMRDDIDEIKARLVGKSSIYEAMNGMRSNRK